MFTMNTDGTDFTNLHVFTAMGGPLKTNSDGARPLAALTISGNTLYGTTLQGGSSGSGTVFAINSNGTGFTNLHNFTALFPSFTNSDGYLIYTNTDGDAPFAGLLLSGDTLYGTTQSGGSSGGGTVFSILLPPPPRLTIASDGSGGYFIDVQGSPNLTYRLQRAHSLIGPWTTSAPQTAPSTGLIEFHDLFPPPDRAFYRALQQ